MSEILDKLGYEIADNHKLIGYVKYDIMREAIYDFFDNKKSAAKDTLLFYYSGHGIPTRSGSTVLASSEVDPDSPNRKGFSSDELTNLIQDSVAIRIVEILDCCYSGSAKVGKGTEDAAATLGTAALENNARMLQQQGEGKCLLAASQAAQEAYGLEEKGHSIFTYYLLEGLNQNKKSVDSNGAVTPHTLGNYVYREIMNLPENKRPKQKPIIKAESAGDIILAYYPELVNKSDQHSIEISWINSGIQYFENEDYINAIDSFDKVLEINPKNQRAYNYKGDAFFKQRRYKEAITSYDKALEINPEYLDVLKDKGLALERLGKDDEAVKCYDEALRIKPDYHEAEYAKKTLLLKASTSKPTMRALSEIRKSTTPHFAKGWGSSGIDKGQFTIIGGLAVDSSGNVYVTDSYHNRIQKFDGEGNFITAWSVKIKADEFTVYPRELAIGPSGYVYVTNANANRIQKFDGEGNFILSWGSKGEGNGQFKTPCGLAVDSSENVYVAEWSNHRIQKFDGEGNFILSWGSKGEGKTQFDEPFAIAIDLSNRVYVSDHGQHCIKKFDGEGNFILSWGSKGEGNGQFKYTNGVATDLDGSVYVCDEKNHRIQKFDGEGNFILSWGGKGKGAGQFDQPVSIAIDPDGNIYAADRNSRIQKFVHPE